MTQTFIARFRVEFLWSCNRIILVREIRLDNLLPTV